MTTAASSRSEESEVARQIARVAARLFATKGYDATSVRMIVEAAGVTKPTLYYHFGSKEGLGQALLTMPMTELAEAMRRLLAAGEDPVTTLERIFEAHFAFCRDDPDRSRFVFALFFGPMAACLSGELTLYKEALMALMGKAVRRLVEAGHVAPGRAESFMAACRGLIIISMMDFLYHGEELGQELAGRLVGDLLHGFAAPAAPDRGSRA
jgi:AcrR family transcriptional regulator